MKMQIFLMISIIGLISCKKDLPINDIISVNQVTTNKGVYTNYLKTSYELSNFKDWYSSQSLYDSDNKKYNLNPFIDEQSAQLDLDGDGVEEVFYYEGYLLSNILTNPPPVIFDGASMKKLKYYGPTIRNPHGTKLLVGDFNGDSLPDLFSLVAIDGQNGPVFSDNYLLLNSKTGLKEIRHFNEQGFWYTGCSGDIDNDGDLDIIAFNFHNQNNGVKNRIMWNDGKGNFIIKKPENADVDNTSIVYQSELCDVDNDGFLDLVIVFVPDGNNRTNDFRILWGNGKGFHLNNSTTIPISKEYYLQNLDFCDIDGDGIKEILPSGNVKDQIYFVNLFKSNDKGKTFTDKTQTYIDNPTTNKRFYHIRVSDIDKNNTLNLFSSDKNDYIIWEWNSTINKFIKQ